LAVVAIAALVAGSLAQEPVRKPASPAGTAATQIGGKYVDVQGRQRYQDGKWIEVTYSRPIKRGRQNLFGAGADYGKAVSDGSPVWRAGANQTTRLKTEVPLVFDGKTLPAGEYSVFVELKENAWTLIFSNWPAQEKYDPNNKDALWGSYGYTPDKDVLRAAMKVETLPFSMDQFTIAFIDIAADGGKLAMMWDKTMATASFKSGS
jgi:predicted transcriptional regulator YdeE